MVLFQDVVRVVVFPSLALTAVTKTYHLYMSESWRGELLEGDSEVLYPKPTVYDVANVCDTSAPDRFIGVGENIGLRTHRELLSLEETSTLYAELLERVVAPFGAPIPKGFQTGLWRALTAANLVPSAGGHDSTVTPATDNDEGSQSFVMNSLAAIRHVTDGWDSTNVEPRAPWGCGDALNPDKMPPILRSLCERVGRSQPNVGKVRHVVISYYPHGMPLMLPNQINSFYGYDYFVVPLVGEGVVDRFKDVEARAKSIGLPTTAPIVHPDSAVLAAKPADDKKKLSNKERKQSETNNETFDKVQNIFRPKCVLTFTPARRSKTTDLSTVADSSWGAYDWDVLLSLGDTLQVSSAARFSWHVSVRPTSWFGERGSVVPGLRSFQFPHGVPFPPFKVDDGRVVPAEGDWSDKPPTIWSRIISAARWGEPQKVETPARLREQHLKQWNKAVLNENINEIVPRDNLHDQGMMLVFIAFEGATKTPRGTLKRPQGLYFGEPPTRRDNTLDDDGKFSYFSDGNDGPWAVIKKAFAALDRSLTVTVMDAGKGVSWR